MGDPLTSFWPLFKGARSPIPVGNLNPLIKIVSVMKCFHVYYEYVDKKFP